jgi:anti-sigma B factor antagonist
VRAVGEVDMYSAPVPAGQFDHATETVTPPNPVVADLLDVQFLGSRGLSLLIVAHQQFQQRGIPFRIVPGPNVMTRLRMSGVLDMLTTYTTVVDALHLARPGQSGELTISRQAGSSAPQPAAPTPPHAATTPPPPQPAPDAEPAAAVAL